MTFVVDFAGIMFSFKVCFIIGQYIKKTLSGVEMGLSVQKREHVLVLCTEVCPKSIVKVKFCL